MGRARPFDHHRYSNHEGNLLPRWDSPDPRTSLASRTPTRKAEAAFKVSPRSPMGNSYIAGPDPFLGVTIHESAANGRLEVKIDELPRRKNWHREVVKFGEMLVT